MRRRRLAPVAALAAAALTLTGCGLGSDDSGSGGAKPTVDANAQVTGEVSFQTWALKPTTGWTSRVTATTRRC